MKLSRHAALLFVFEDNDAGDEDDHQRPEPDDEFPVPTEWH